MLTPEWLTKRDGSLKPGVPPSMIYVLLGGVPQYKVQVRPAGGKFFCAVQQSNNGKRLDDNTIYPTEDAALVGGFEQLRAKLGW